MKVGPGRGPPCPCGPQGVSASNHTNQIGDLWAFRFLLVFRGCRAVPPDGPPGCGCRWWPR